jgi:poly(A) polymerase Pap1
MAVTKAEEDVTASNLAKDTGLSESSVRTIAMKLASGEITSLEGFGSAVEDSRAALISFGKQLMNNTAAEEVTYDAMMMNAENMADMSHLTEEEQERAKNVTTDATYKAIEGKIDS